MHLIFSLYLFIAIPLYGLGGQFLVLPSDATELSLGSHPTLQGLSSLNPALFSVRKKNPVLLLSQGNWIGDVSIGTLDYSQNLKNKVFYFGVRYSGLSDLEFRGDKPQNEPLAYFTSYGLSLKSGLAIKRGNTQYGISFSYISMGIYIEKSSGFSMGFGYSVDIKEDVKLGISLQNIGSMSALSNDSPQLPKRLLIGYSKFYNFKKINNTIYNSIELNNINNFSKYKLSFGNKLSWKQLGLLNGVSLSDNIIYYSIGLNLNFKNYDITYGINMNSFNLGLAQIISLRLDLP